MKTIINKCPVYICVKMTFTHCTTIDDYLRVRRILIVIQSLCAYVCEMNVEIELTIYRAQPNFAKADIPQR